MRPSLTNTAFVLLCLILSACTTVNVERFDQVQNSEVDIVYVNPDADFSNYHQLLPMPLEIGYSAKLGEPDPDKLQRIRSLFREAFLAQVQGNYEIVDKPGADVLRVRASLLDLKINTAEGGVALSGDLKKLAKSGKLTFLMEVQDSLTGNVLLRAGDTEKDDSDTSVDEWADVENAAVHWAAMFRQFLDNQLGKQG